MLPKPETEQKVDSMQQLHSNHDPKQQKISSHVDDLVNALIECGSQITNIEEFYKPLNISRSDLFIYEWISAIVTHSDLFLNTALCKSSSVQHNKVQHIYWNVFERLLFELDLFHLYFAYDVMIDNHSPWDNLNPSSIFILCGNLQKLYEKTQPKQSEIKLFFDKSARFHPILKYKYVNSDAWKRSDTFINVNADINNDYNYASRILHPLLFDDKEDVKHNDDDDDAHKKKDGSLALADIVEEIKQHNNSDNHFCYKVYLEDKKYKSREILIHSNIIKDTFNVNTNEELSRNMVCPSMYLSGGHVLGARKWIPDSDLYGTVCIRCHHTIMIQKQAVISATGAGYTSHYGKGHGSYYKEAHKKNQGSKYYSGGGFGTKGADAHEVKAKGGATYGEDTLKDILHFGSPSGGRERGGGIIELIAKYIINYGKIVCDGDSGKQFGGGSGGSIKIVCQKFINYGKVTASGGKGGVYERKYDNNTALRVGGKGGYGRITIYCEKFLNKGVIAPIPNVVGSDKFSFNNGDNIGFSQLASCKDNKFYA